MYSNNESFLPDKVKRNELEKTRGESGRESESYKEPGNQAVYADRVTWLVFEYQVKAFFLWWIHMARKKWSLLPDCNDDAQWMWKRSRWQPKHRETTTVVITNDGVGEGWICTHNNLKHNLENRYFGPNFTLPNMWELYICIFWHWYTKGPKNIFVSSASWWMKRSIWTQKWCS